MRRALLLLSLGLAGCGGFAAGRQAESVAVQEAASGPALEALEALDQRAARLLDAGLADGQAWSMLEELLRVAPQRLSGSAGYQRAVEWAEQAMRDAGLSKVRREPVMVPRWERGSVERALLQLQDEALELAACTLGGSVATPAAGLRAPVVEVDGLEGLQAAGAALRGKIAFLNRPMDPKARSTFQSYGEAVGQRSRGAIEAAKHGAVAVVVRSMSTARDDRPHTGAVRYQEGVAAIPAFALGVLSAERLSAALAAGAVQHLTLHADCRTLPEVEQWNVIGELPGSAAPEEIVLVGGHLDAWDKGQGAHDCGGGCVQSIEALRLLRACGVRPRRTVRAVLFANEENGLRGALEYARRHGGEPHFFALESDSGVFAPRGVAFDLPEALLERLRPFGKPLAAVGAEQVAPGGGGADVGPLKTHGAIVGSLVVDDARYFDLHHSDNDVLAAVHPRELELGAVVLAHWLAVLADLDAAAVR